MNGQHHFQLQQHNQPFCLTQGFLPSSDPIVELPSEVIAWEGLALELPKLITNSNVRQEIESLPEFELSALTSYQELERAMMILSFIGHAYVWSDSTKPMSRLPHELSQAWHGVATQLQRPPVLSYASYALYNWYRFDSEKPIELGNIALLQNFLGGADEEWFVLIHVDIEAKAVPLLQSLLPLQSAAQDHDIEKMQYHLDVIESGLSEINKTMNRMTEHCDPYIYFHRVRPYIHGWKNNPALPDGLLYPGVSEYQNKPVQFKGETGAQSGIIPCLDAVLGVYHADNPLKAHLNEMREYMPPQHRAFLTHLEQQQPIRDQIIQAKNSTLKERYNNCLTLIHQFRSTHYTYAAQYIDKQAQIDQSNPNEIGTGGTPFIQYLKKHQDETSLKLI